MDEKALTELLECSVCLDQLDHTSKVLPCQHTFCKRCLEEIFITKHELRCPECRMLVEMRVDDLPSNILLIRLLEGIKTQTRTGGTQGYLRESGSPSHARGDKSSPAAAVGVARHHQQRQGNGGNRPCAKALFNYIGNDPGDLTLKKGDVVYLRKKVDENWFHGELNGLHGFFPATYVQVLTPLPTTVPQCKGLYDFEVDDNKEGDCLSFKKDEVVTVIRKVDDNWLEGKKGDKIGIFPVSFVQMNEPAKILLKQTGAISPSGGSGSSSQDPGPPGTPAHPSRPAKEKSPSHVSSGPTPGPRTGTSPGTNYNKRHSLSNLSQTQPSAVSLLQRHSLEISSDMSLVAMGGQTSTSLSSLGNLGHAGSGGNVGSVSMQSDSAAVVKSYKPENVGSATRPDPQSPDKDASGDLSRVTGPASVSGDMSRIIGPANVSGDTSRVAGPASVSGDTLRVTGPASVSTDSSRVTGPASASGDTSRVTGPSSVSGDLSRVTGPANVSGDPSRVTGPVSVTTKVGSAGDSGVTSTTSQKQLTEESSSSTSSSSTAPIYVSLYNYKPQKADEIELRKGDYYSVSEKCQDGWYKGQCLKSATAGVFPGNYLQSVRTHSSAFKPVNNKPGSTKSKDGNSSSGQSLASNPPTSVPPRPKTSSGQSSKSSSQSSMDVGRSKSANPSRTSSTDAGRSKSADRELAPPPVVPRSGKASSSPLQNVTAYTAHKGHKSSSPVAKVSSSSTSSPNSPVLGTSSKTTRYIRASKSISPNTNLGGATRPEASQDGSVTGGSSQAATSAGGDSSSSPVWKHSLSASSNITPPNVVVGAAGGKSAPGPTSLVMMGKDKDKKERKDKEKVSLMKRLTTVAGGKTKKPKIVEVEGAASLSDSGVNHSRSGSYPSEAAVGGQTEPHHKKSGSFDSSTPGGQPKPARPKPLIREKYQCTETYPTQSEIELDLKIGDIIYVHKKRDDGWYKGTLQRSGKTGLFPGIFAQKCD